jgi:methylmalonyl-CoA mutase C-terminal domain/subunit
MNSRRIRVLIAKPGLDGRDRGAKVVAQALKQAGMEVIYSGLRQTIPQIVQTALQEDVDVIGLSILSGAHLTLCRDLVRKLQEEKKEAVILVGGNIPRKDIDELKTTGVQGVFPTGSTFEAIVERIEACVKVRGS